jgi:hypothetical protein
MQKTQFGGDCGKIDVWQRLEFLTDETETLDEKNLKVKATRRHKSIKRFKYNNTGLYKILQQSYP